MTGEMLEIGSVLIADDDETPVALVRHGDVAAFRLIFEQHHQLVLKFLIGMVGETDLAEEMMQETFVRAFQSINTLKDESRLATWLCAIAKNIVYNSFRARRTDPPKVELDGHFPIELSSAEMLPDEKLLNDELKKVIEDALKKLDDDKRAVFTLKMMKNLSYEEIAEITGFSIGKLKTDLHRAKIEMRKLIRPYLRERR